MKKFIVVALVMGMLSLAAAAQALELGAKGYYWLPAFSGDLTADTDMIEGTKIDLKDDLGLKSDGTPQIELFAGVGDHRLSLMYTYLAYEGKEMLKKEIIFNGKSYGAGIGVDSKFTLHMVDLEYQYKVLNLENILAGASLGLIGKVKYFAGEAGINQPFTDDTVSFNFGLPMLGVVAHAGILKDKIEAEAKFAAIRYSGNIYMEGGADLSFSPMPFLDINGGYKFMRLEVDDVSDAYADLEFIGPYLGLTVSF